MKSKLLLTIISILFSTQILQANWTYRQTIEISPADTILTDYQLQLILTPGNFDYTHSVGDSGQDLRFSTDNTGSTEPNVYYWIEDWNENDTSLIWIKVPSISDVDNTIIYMYYGNSTATSESNGDSTFIFFDDFEDGNWTDKWMQSRMPASAGYSGNDYEYATITESNGVVTFTDCCQNDGICSQGAGVLISNNSIILNRDPFTFDVIGNIASSSAGLSAWSANIVGDTMYADPFPVYDRKYGVVANTYSNDITMVFFPTEQNIQTHLLTYNLGANYRHIVHYDGSTNGELKIYDNLGNLVGSRIDSYAYSDSSKVRVMFYVDSPGSFFDMIKIYKHYDPAPTISTTAIETIGNWTLSSTIAHWTFDEMAGDTLFDVSGNGHSGIISNANWTNGYNGGALSFNGSNSEVTVSSDSSFSSMSELTVEAIFNVSELPLEGEYGRIAAVFGPFYGFNSSTPQAWALGLGMSTDGPYLSFGVRTDANTSYDGTGVSHYFDSFPLNSWVHAAGVCDNGYFYLYLNNTLIDSHFIYTDASINYADIPLTIGYSTGTNNNNDSFNTHFSGLIDEIRVTEAVLMTGQFLDFTLPPENITLSIPELSASVNDTLFVPLNIQFSNTATFSSAEITIGGYQGRLEFLGVDTTNSMIGAAGWSYAVNETDSLVISWMAGAQPISGSGVFCNLKFVATGSPCSTYPVNIISATFDTGTDSVVITNGSVTINPVPSYGDADENGTLQAYDASLILKHLVGIDTLVCQGLVNAEVSCNDTLTAYDASLILRRGVGLIDSLPWCEPVLASGEVGISDITINAGGTFDFPVFINNGEHIYSYEGTVVYDAEKITYIGISSPGGDSLSDSLIPGEIHFAGASAQAHSSDGEFLVFHFETAADLDETTISLENLRLNENPVISIVGTASVVLGTDLQAMLPKAYALHQNYPNPFNPVTTIQYDLPQDSDVRLVIYDILGQEIRILVDNMIPAGRYEVRWNGQNNFGANMPTGMYFARITTPDYSQTIKIVLMK